MQILNSTHIHRLHNVLHTKYKTFGLNYLIFVHSKTEEFDLLAAAIIIMAESIVTDWLSDYAALESSEVRTFAAEHEHNHEIAHALFTILNERLKYPDVSVVTIVTTTKIT